MKLPRLAIENYQFTLVVILLLVLSGSVSLITMPRSEDPQVSQAGGSVFVIYPGANPLDLEQLVVDPLEEAINELEDINKMSSFLEDGIAVINTEFMSGTDPDEKFSDLLQKVNTVQSQLPEDILRIGTEKWAISNVNILQVALISEQAPYSELEQEADRLKKSFEKISGVKTAKIWAFPEQEVRVALDMEKLAQLKIPLTSVIGAIQSANVNIPGGYIDIGPKRLNIQTSRTFAGLDELRSTIVFSTGTDLVYLKDVATVFYTNEDNNYFARVNGKRALFITANQKEGTNIFTISRQLKQTLQEFEQELPQSIRTAIVFDQSNSVAHRLNSFLSNLLQGLILVSIVVLAGVGFRASLIVIIVIPISIFVGIGFVDLSGFGIEQMTIAGLVIALGLLVDNAIVVSENISRFLNKGYDHKTAAVEGTSQVGWAIISATTTTVLAFLPIIMMRNITGQFIRSMPITVVYTLLASLLLALVLTPYLSSKFLRKTNSVRAGLIQKSLEGFIENKYGRLLGYALEHRATILLIAFIVFLGSLSLFPLVGVSFFPKAEKPQIVINVDTPQGSSLNKTNDAIQFAESILDQEADVELFLANIGRSNPRIYYNIIPKRQRSTHGQLIVQLKQFELQTMADLLQRLRVRLADYPGARFEVKELKQGPPFEAPIAIKILGENLSILRDLAHDVEQMIKAAPGTINVHNPLATSKTELKIKINRAKAGLLGIPLHEIDRTIRACIAGYSISKFRNDKGQEFNIVVRLPLQDSAQLTDFAKIYLTSASGEPVPLKHIASLEMKSSPQEINHYNLERNVTITADVIGNQSVDRATQFIINQMDEYSWPKGYRYYVAGELESRQKLFGGMFQAVIVALIAILGVLVLQFRSFTQPLIVFSAIPLAVIGSILALLITGLSFSFMAFVGLASLVGIVVNNSIILVDYTNQLRKRELAIVPALLEAGKTRFLPIILTTITTIGGLLPLTLQGGSTWAPMGWTIIGGLLTSTFLTLIVVPVLYKVFTPNCLISNPENQVNR